MDTNLQTIANDAQATLTAVDSAQAVIDGQAQQIGSLTQQNSLLADEVAADEQTIQTLRTELSTTQAQLAVFLNTKVFDGLELTPWLVAGGTAANSGQTGSTAVATQAQPGTSSAWFNLAPAGPYANGYWFKKLGADPAKKNYEFEISFLFGTAADAQAANCVELDIQQVIAGVVFNTGLQFDFTENALRVWDRSKATPADPGAGDWVPTGITCPRWTPGQWVRVVFETHRDDSHVYVDAITINGQRNVFGGATNFFLQPTFAAPKLGLTDMLNCAVQLDGNKAGTAFKLYVDAISFTAS